MKKILLLLISVLVLTGCTSEPSIVVDNKLPLEVTLGQIPSASELIKADENTTLEEELIGNKLIVTATSENKEYTYEYDVEYSQIEIDGTLEQQDISQFFSDPEKAKVATYSLNNDVMAIIYEDNSFDVPVVIDMPEVSVDEDVTIDVYTGYDFENFIHESEGVTHEYTYEDGVLTVVFTKNNWSETITREVTKTDSSPYPRVYVQKGWWGPGDKWYTNSNNLTLTINGDGTGTWHNVGISNTVGQYVGGPLTYDSENFYSEIHVMPYWFDDDGNLHRIETGGLDEVIYERIK